MLQDAYLWGKHRIRQEMSHICDLLSLMRTEDAQLCMITPIDINEEPVIAKTVLTVVIML